MNTKEVSHEKYQELLKDCEPACKNRFCFYRMYMEKQHVPIFIVVQVQLMVKMKYIWETTESANYGFDVCAMRWNDTHFATAYRMAFEEALDNEDVEAIFWRTIAIQKKLAMAAKEKVDNTN
jgi:hypothetical protein